jgi:hypothetical protein
MKRKQLAWAEEYKKPRYNSWRTFYAPTGNQYTTFSNMNIKTIKVLFTKLTATHLCSIKINVLISEVCNASRIIMFYFLFLHEAGKT